MHLLDRVFVKPEPEIQKGGWWSTSAKYEDTNIAFGSRQVSVYLTTILEFYLSPYLIYDSWMCIRL
jgi:hypothetical protein